MWKSSFIVLAITAIILSGCGSADEKGASQSNVSLQSAAANSPEPSPAPEQEKKLTDTEKMALDYVNIYLNGSDLNAKKQFVTDKIHPDMQEIFRLGESNETAAENKLLNPQVKQSIDLKSDGKDVTATLIAGDENGAKSEMIILSADGKVAFGYSRVEDDPEMQKKYDEMRAKFK